MPLVFGVTFRRDDVTKGLASNRTSHLVEAHLDTSVSTAHEQSMASDHYCSCSIVLCSPATWSFTQ